MSMMSAELYDALIDAGAGEEKARAAASAIGDVNQLATKADMDEQFAKVKSDIEQLRLSTKADIEAVKTDIEQLRLNTKADIEAVKTDIEQLRLSTKADIEQLRLSTKADTNLLRWMVGFNLAMTAAILLALIFK